MTKKTILCFLLLFSLSASAQNKAARLDSLFSKLNQEKKFFGNVLIAEKGKVLYQKSFGMADMAAGRRLNAESVFELASVSKQFTAMAIMLLKKQGKLNYDDSLRKFFPELPYANITVRNLLQHTSGLPDYMDLLMTKGDTNRIQTNNDIIRLMSLHKPAALFRSGEKWEYSNTGYALLSGIIEKASAMQYGQYLAKYIFKPLGMKRTEVYRRRFEKRTIENYAYGYVMNTASKTFTLPDDDTALKKFIYTLDGITGDGTVNSTTGDLLKWDRALNTEKLVNRQMLHEAFTPAALNNGAAYPYGFGWGIDSINTIGRIVNHSGGWPGYATFIERHLDAGTTIIILRNYEETILPYIEVRNILYNIQPEIKKEITLSGEMLHEYTGEYELAPNFTLTVSTDGKKLFARATGQQMLQLYAEKKDQFFYKAVKATVLFVRNAGNNVTSLILQQNGRQLEGKKIK